MNALEFRFAFYARDFEKSVGFYRDVLGLKYISGWDRADGKGALFSAGGNAVVEIYGAANGEIYKGPSPVALNLAIRVENKLAVAHYYQQLAGQGVDKIQPPQDHPWGHRSFVVFDPDGIPIHIYCELE